jgi:methionyl-tRNA formyltransferase
MERVAVFVNGELGKSIIRRVMEHPDLELSAIVLNARDKRLKDYKDSVIELENSLCANFNVYEWSFDLITDVNFLKDIRSCGIAISALFGHIIPKEIIEIFESRIINLHPSLLPLGKGSDPVPWGIIQGYSQGASIHTVTEKLDSGKILSQELIDSNLGMNAGEVYQNCIDSLLYQFDSIIDKVISNDLKLKPQNDLHTVPRKSIELKEIQVIDANETFNLESLIRRIQALTFSDGRRPKLRDKEGNIWTINLSLKKDE